MTCPTTGVTVSPAAQYFFTVNLQDRASDLLITHINALRAAVRNTRQRQPFHIDAWVVLPDHLHCKWTLPEHDDDYSSRWRAIKKAFSKSIPKTEYRSQTHHKRHERDIWQRRFWEHTITGDRLCRTHGLHSLQPGETWLGGIGERLAVFDFSSVG